MLNHSRDKKSNGLLICFVSVLLGLSAVLFYSIRHGDKPDEETAGLDRPQPRLPEGQVPANAADSTHITLEFFPNIEGIECVSADERPTLEGLLEKMNVRGPIWKDLRMTVGRTADYEDQFCAARSVNNGPVRCVCHSTPLPAGGVPPSDPIDEVVVTPPGIGKK